jgi:hypothetical protein
MMSTLRRATLIAILGGVTVAVWTMGNLPKTRFAVLAPLTVRADDDSCSTTSLHGTYAMQAQGTIVGQIPGLPPPPFPFAEAGIVAFDGTGNLSGHSTVNAGGLTSPALFTGSYTVKSDCTGTLAVNLNNGLIAHDATVVVRGGREFHDVQTDSFGVIARNGERIGD